MSLIKNGYEYPIDLSERNYFTTNSELANHIIKYCSRDNGQLSKQPIITVADFKMIRPDFFVLGSMSYQCFDKKTIFDMYDWFRSEYLERKYHSNLLVQPIYLSNVEEELLEYVDIEEFKEIYNEVINLDSILSFVEFKQWFIDMYGLWCDNGGVFFEQFFRFFAHHYFWYSKIISDNYMTYKSLECNFSLETNGINVPINTDEMSANVTSITTHLTNIAKLIKVINNLDDLEKNASKMINLPYFCKNYIKHDEVDDRLQLFYFSNRTVMFDSLEEFYDVCRMMKSNEMFYNTVEACVKDYNALFRDGIYINSRKDSNKAKLMFAGKTFMDSVDSVIRRL